MRTEKNILQYATDFQFLVVIPTLCTGKYCSRRGIHGIPWAIQHLIESSRKLLHVFVAADYAQMTLVLMKSPWCREAGLDEFHK